MKRKAATLAIERFDLRLPAGFEQRGAAIAREALRLLAKRRVGWSGQLSRLDVPGLRIQGSETNAVIALNSTVSSKMIGMLAGRLNSGLPLIRY